MSSAVKKIHAANDENKIPFESGYYRDRVGSCDVVTVNIEPLKDSNHTGSDSFERKTATEVQMKNKF